MLVGRFEDEHAIAELRTYQALSVDRAVGDLRAYAATLVEVEEDQEASLSTLPLLLQDAYLLVEGFLVAFTLKEGAPRELQALGHYLKLRQGVTGKERVQLMSDWLAIEAQAWLNKAYQATRDEEYAPAPGEA